MAEVEGVAAVALLTELVVEILVAVALAALD